MSSVVTVMTDPRKAWGLRRVVAAGPWPALPEAGVSANSDSHAGNWSPESSFPDLNRFKIQQHLKHSQPAERSEHPPVKLHPCGRARGRGHAGRVSCMKSHIPAPVSNAGVSGRETMQGGHGASERAFQLSAWSAGSGRPGLGWGRSRVRADSTLQV